MKLTRSSTFLIGYYLGLIILWLGINYYHARTLPINLLYAFSFGLLPILGGILGIFKARGWGLFKSSMGKAVFLLSCGLITWGIGQVIFSYYPIFLNIEVPYPSLADASFIWSWPLWSIGVIFLSKATGAKYGLRSKTSSLYLIFIPILMFVFSYYFLVIIARGGVITSGGDLLKVALDIIYPVWSILIVTIALIVYGLSFKFLGGKYKWPVLITLLGFLINYFGDFGFSYTTTIGAYFNADWVDFLFTTAMFTISLGVSMLDIKED